MIQSLACFVAVALLVAVAPVAAQDVPDAAPPPANPLLIERDVTVDAMVSDRFTWHDAGNQPRVAVLAHNDGPAGPGGTRGGELREFRYQTPGGTRSVRASGSSASGFGYVVSHRREGAAGIGADDSPLGHFFPGQFQRVFEGRHHVIFRFTQLYPRFSRTDATPPNTRYDVPVTLDWVFATGRDHPLWAITWDLSGVPVNAVESDSRAPYGELLFDGAASEGAHSVIAGVGWGDGRTFVTTTSPVTYNSGWTWNTPNTIPYVKLWTTTVDATMGTVLTQTKAQQDAGGYFGADRWDSTSAGGNACDPNVNMFHDATHLMPCDFNWPYQSINFSLNPATPNVPTFNTRLAWGTNFGFLGQAQYLVHGSGSFGGPDPDTFAPGYPKKSYSTFVVLGLNSADPVGAQVAQIGTVQTTTLTAAIGSVVTTGPAGVNRADTVTYAPAGWNHVYAAWAVQAAANQVDANFNVGAGTLSKPLVIVSSWTAGALPGTVRLNGATLVQDADYFPSLRAGSQELWITLNHNLAGATNRLEILPAPGGPSPGSPDLAVAEADAPDPVTVGGSLTYTLTVSNSGLATATGVTLTDALLAGVSFVSATPSQGSCNGTGTVTCGLGTLTTGATATVTIVVTATAAGTISNTVVVAANESDANAANNSATATTTVVAQQFTLTVITAGTGGGTVSSQPGGIGCPTDCVEGFPSGTVVTLFALPASGSLFSGWSGGGCGGTGPCMVTLTADTTVTAAFDPTPPGTVGLMVIRAGTGTGSVTSVPPGIDCGTDCVEALPSGTVVTLTATAAPGSFFMGWSGGGCGGRGSCTVAAVQDVAVAAPFTSMPPDLVSASVNQAGFSVGHTLTASIRANNPGLPTIVDFYMGLLLPDGDTIVFFTSGGVAFGRLSSLATFQPLAAAVSLTMPFTVTVPDFFTYTWTGSEPRGRYVVFLAAILTGALADGTVDPGDVVALSAAPFTFGP